MSAYDNFMIQYQDIDLIDINNIICEAIRDTGTDIDSVEMIAPALYARGYIIVPIEKEDSNA